MKTIETKRDYEDALKRFEKSFQAARGTSESDEADIMASLIADYEKKHFVIEVPTTAYPSCI